LGTIQLIHAKHTMFARLIVDTTQKEIMGNIGFFSIESYRVCGGVNVA